MYSSLWCRNQGFAVAASHFGRRLISSSRILACQDDFRVSYLVHSCGLSPDAAIVASQKVKFQSLEKPESVLALFRQYEFSDAQISNIVRNSPRVLAINAQKTLLPKLEFLTSIGMSRLDLAKTLSNGSWLFNRSLEKSIIPCYNFLKSVVISDAKVLHILRLRARDLGKFPSKDVLANVRLVTELGMPHPCLVLMLTFYTSVVTRRHELFTQIVSQVEEMGFDPGKSNFVQAMVALSGRKTTRRVKEEAYKRWGWSESDTRSAFKMCPNCMIVSEKKIMGIMDILVNKMGWESGKIAKCPYVLMYSLEKRIIPRCSVARVLLLKGLIEEKKLSMASVCLSPEKIFLNGFVTRFLDHVPQLVNVYRGKMDVQDV
ncbi:uncharacterized protein LOC126797515 [Argentina anserina]|uniref:uncharacterized protein LOC126797515 n=1 Tax=Argentina anserina TaxID=57926 RepID=UPI002176674B|nr:uncharacterized protein LOC126797515 [Potentilla anserina]